MLSTKLWLVTQVAMAITARPIMLASKTRHPNCSRIGMRIFTIALHTKPLVCDFSKEAEGEAAETWSRAVVSQRTLLESSS